MAIIKCPNCGNDISDKAEKCIHCGYELTKKVGNVCPECGAELEDGAKVCSKCGCPISPESSAAPQKVEVTGVSLKPKSKKPLWLKIILFPFWLVWKTIVFIWKAIPG